MANHNNLEFRCLHTRLDSDRHLSDDSMEWLLGVRKKLGRIPELTEKGKLMESLIERLEDSNPPERMLEELRSGAEDIRIFDSVKDALEGDDEKEYLILRLKQENGEPYTSIMPRDLLRFLHSLGRM